MEILLGFEMEKTGENLEYWAKNFTQILGHILIRDTDNEIYWSSPPPPPSSRSYLPPPLVFNPFLTGAAKAVPTAPPTNTPQILQTTDKNDDFVDGIIGGAIVLGMILIIYACHSCYIRFCRNRRDNAGAILNLPNMVQLPSQFPIGPPFLHKDDGITRGVARIF